MIKRPWILRGCNVLNLVKMSSVGDKGLGQRHLSALVGEAEFSVKTSTT
jgi:hypothetical protein